MELRLRKSDSNRVKLIFNPISGAPGQSPAQLMEIVQTMQRLDLVPEVYMIEPDTQLEPVIKDALKRGIHLFAVSGGDGTVDPVAGILADTHATLAVIPTGTQNNVALSLGVPADIPSAVTLLKTGRRVKADVGFVQLDNVKYPFLEACSVGLLSALFPAADDIQHGNLARIGDLLAALVSSPPAEIRMVLDRSQEINTQGHVVLVGNMPYAGPHYRLDPQGAYDDGLLDVAVFANQTKLELLGNVVQLAGGGQEDPRIQRYHVRSLYISTNPPMPILADGCALGEGPLKISVQHQALAMFAGEHDHAEPPGADVDLPGIA